MKFVKTDFSLKVNASSSWIIYVAKTYEDASDIFRAATATITAQKAIRSGDPCYTVSINRVMRDDRVPTFFHSCGYWMTCIELYNGDWNSTPTYALYIVE